MLCEAVLRRGDFAYLGLIGSKTKRRRFERGFRELGIAPDMIARLTCPIGGKEVRDKRPAVIAALTAAELLTHWPRSARRDSGSGRERRIEYPRVVRRLSNGEPDAGFE